MLSTKQKKSFASLTHYKIISQAPLKRPTMYSAYRFISISPLRASSLHFTPTSVSRRNLNKFPSLSFTIIKQQPKGVSFMPKRNKLPSVPDYVDSGRNPENLLVQKSNPLQSLSKTSMTLPEFKILDAYLSRIDSHDAEKRYVRFEKGELEKILCVTRILKPDLEKRLRNLFQVLEINDDTKQKGFKLISLFSKAECEQDDNGLWQVDLACTPEAMEYIFNIDNIGYLRYRLKNVIDLTSRYSYILYLYLENNRFRKSWDVDLDELKQLLCCTAETYSQYYRLNDLILKRCHKELTEKTALRFTYEPIKKGRKVAAIRFTLETLSDSVLVDTIPSQKQLSMLDDDDKAAMYSNPQLGFLAGACDYEFEEKEMRVLFDKILEVLPSTDQIERYNFLRHKYNELNLQASRTKITSRFGYLKKMLG